MRHERLELSYQEGNLFILDVKDKGTLNDIKVALELNEYNFQKEQEQKRQQNIGSLSLSQMSGLDPEPPLVS